MRARCSRLDWRCRHSRAIWPLFWPWHSRQTASCWRRHRGTGPSGCGTADRERAVQTLEGHSALCYGRGILAGRQAAGVCISGHNRQAVGRPIGSGGADARGPFPRPCSRPWNILRRTASCWRRHRGTRPSGCGTADRERRCRRSRAIRPMLRPWHSRRTASCWRRHRGTRPSGCGTADRERRCRRSRAIRTMFRPWHSRRTASCWASASATTRPSGCWDGRSGAAVQTLEGHSAHVLAVAFSPDGKLLASASADKTARLWDGRSGAAVQTLEGHSGHVSAVAFSPDGKLLASASWDRTVRLWDGHL